MATWKRIQQRQMVLLSLLLATALATSGFALVVQRQQAFDAHIINLAGKQRMLSQRMAKAALASSSAAWAVDELKQSVDQFDRAHLLLAKGNVALGYTPADEPVIVAQLQRVDQLWAQVRPATLMLSTPSKSPTALHIAQLHLLTQHASLLDELDYTVTLFETAAQARQTRMSWVLVMGMALVLIIGVAIWFSYLRLVLLPSARMAWTLEQRQSQQRSAAPTDPDHPPVNPYDHKVQAQQPQAAAAPLGMTEHTPQATPEQTAPTASGSAFYQSSAKANRVNPITHLAQGFKPR